MAEINPEIQNEQPSNMILEYPDEIIQENMQIPNDLINQVNHTMNNTINNQMNYPMECINPIDSMNSMNSMNNYSYYNQSFTDNLYKNSFNELDGSPYKIMKIRKEFNDYLSNNFTEKLDINNDEIMKEIINKIDIVVKNIDEVMKIFDNQQTKVLDLEDKINKTIKNIEKDTEKINDFSEFTEKISSKYKDINIEKINDSILEICESIKNESENLELKREYHKELYILKYLFHHFIKKINQGNNGSTCSLCMSNQVNTFLEPCGHTCCSECIDKYLDNRNNSKCFICREVIFKKHKLYFI